MSAGPDSSERGLWETDSELHGPAFESPPSPPPRLVMFGAVPLAAALCSVGRAAGWAPYVVDPRARFAVAERFVGAERVIVAWPAQAVAELGGLDAVPSAVLALAHDPQLDDPALVLALRSEAVFVGAMGSRRNQARRRERLLGEGLSGAEASRLAGPIGLDTGAATAAEAAVAIVAEIVAVRNRRSGGRLSEAEGSVRGTVV
ncbi:MAG: XdhC family protein [Solirubrobacteraceae bacterium]